MAVGVPVKENKEYITDEDLAGAMTDLMARAKKVEAEHEGRRSMHELDHSLWRLDEYILEELRHNSRIKKENYPSFTSNAPRTLSRATMSVLTKNKPRIRINLPTDVTDAESRVINANERLIEGAIYENDLIRGRRGDNNLQQEIVWYIAHRGGVVIRPLVVPESKVTAFPIDVYDPYECVWDDGYEGLIFFARHYREDKPSVIDRWGLEDDDDEPASSASTNEVEMYDVWWTERTEKPETSGTNEGAEKYEAINVYNAVIAGGKWAKTPTLHREFTHIPVYVVRSGGTPARMSGMNGDASGNWRTDQWESIYTNVRATIGWLNRAATLYSLYLREGAIGPWVYKGGKNKNIGSPRAFTTIRIAPGESFGPVAMPAMAQEAKQFMTHVGEEWSKAGVSEVIFGNIPFRMSGFGMLQMTNAVEALMNGYIHAIESVYTFITQELTEQFVTVGKRRKFQLKGFDSRGKAFMENISPKDVTTMYIPEVTLKSGMPDDPSHQGQAAALWTQAGVPRSVIFEKIFNSDDSQAWEREKRRQDIGAMPVVMMLEAVADLVEAGRTEAAKLIMQQLAQQGIQANGTVQSQPAQTGDQSGNVPPNLSGRPESPNPLAQSSAVPAEIMGIGEQSGQFGGGGRPAIGGGSGGAPVGR